MKGSRLAQKHGAKQPGGGRKIMTFAASLVVLAAALAPGGAAAAPVVDCHKLAGTTVAASAIGLPTRGARVTQVADVPASSAVPAHCLVSGAIAPVDPAAPPIRFQLALPSHWNGKALMLGGGGFNGVIPSVVGTVANAPASAATPLARGYAVFGSDSGHEGKRAGVSIGREDGAFFSNEESYRNYIGDALKKTHDAADRLIRQVYGRAPARHYFSGGSKGGGAALIVAARWPADWDGVVALYPAHDFTITMLGLLALSETLTALSTIDQGDRDLTPFARRGGKLLILQGTNDILVSPRATERYVDELRARMGEARLAAFLRYYEVPGFGHALSTVFGASWDQLSALENWVEKKIDPATNQIVTDTTSVPGRTRPLCLYPSWPKYRGAGDINSAASFSCVTR
jgi:hypothetical protein